MLVLVVIVHPLILLALHVHLANNFPGLDFACFLVAKCIARSSQPTGGWIITDNLHSGKLVCETQNVSIANLIAQERRGCLAAMMEQIYLGTHREIAPVSNVQLQHDGKFGDTESVD